MTEPEPAAYGTPGQRPSSPLFEFNRPTVVVMLFLAAPFFILTAVIGVALAYAWRADVREGEAWEWAHYTYHIRTFWLAIAFLGGALATVVAVLVVAEGVGETEDILTLLAGGAVILVLALLALLVVRCVFALIRAQSRLPMPRPRTWLV